MRDYILMKLIVGLALCLGLAAAQSVERWGVYEVTLRGPSTGNPFLEVRLGAHFRYGHRVVDVDGFYDGRRHLPHPLHAR